jgi:hypothetical protein
LTMKLGMMFPCKPDRANIFQYFFLFFLNHSSSVNETRSCGLMWVSNANFAFDNVLDKKWSFEEWLIDCLEEFIDLVRFFSLVILCSMLDKASGLGFRNIMDCRGFLLGNDDLCWYDRMFKTLLLKWRDCFI